MTSTAVGGPSRSACEPCRNRKIKCSGERPICRRCQKAGKECIYQSQHDPAYVSGLEERVRELESQLRSSPGSLAAEETPGRPPKRPAPASSMASRPLPNSASLFRARRSSTRPMDAPHRSASPSSSLTLQLGLAEDIISDAQLVARLPISFDLPGDLSRRTTSGPSRAHGSQRPTAVQVDRTIFPSRAVIGQLIDHFRTCTGAEYPIFHIPSLLRLVDEVCFDPSGDSMNGDGTLASPADVCIVSLVLAVAATSLRRTSPLYRDYKPRAADLWEYACSHLDTALEIRGLSRLQILLIQLQYVLYNPDSGDVWELCGSMMRTVVDMGLHRERPLLDGRQAQSGLEQDMRRRLFWIAYNLDRNVCTALGRPSSLPDAWIDVPFPSIIDDALIGPDCISPGEPSPLKAIALHRYRLRVLHSEIHNRLYITRPDIVPISPEWYVSVVDRLNEWRDTLPLDSDLCTTEWWLTKYHLTLILLYRSSPANLNPDQTQLSKALLSAGAVMSAYREQYRKGAMNFNWFTVYQLFVAGVTYLNSLWQARLGHWSIVANHVEAMLEVQQSLGVMQALEALTPGTTSIRTAYETVTEHILRLLTSGAQWQPTLSNVDPAGQSTSSLPATIPYATPQHSGGPGQLTLAPESIPAADIFGSYQPDQSGLDPALGVRPADAVGEEYLNSDSLFSQPLGSMSVDEWAILFGGTGLDF